MKRENKRIEEPVEELKELSLWNKIKYLNHNIFRTRCFKPLIFHLILQNSQFEISKVCNIWFQRYSDQKIRVCGKDSIPLQLIKNRLKKCKREKCIQLRMVTEKHKHEGGGVTSASSLAVSYITVPRRPTSALVKFTLVGCTRRSPITRSLGSQTNLDLDLDLDLDHGDLDLDR